MYCQNVSLGKSTVNYANLGHLVLRVQQWNGVDMIFLWFVSTLSNLSDGPCF